MVFRSWIVRFKWAELIAKTEVVPVWQPVLPLEISIADQRSQTYSSADEWSVSRACFEEVFRQFGLRPTVDAFESRSNSLCEKFFSKWLQVGSSGVNFLCTVAGARGSLFLLSSRQGHWTHAEQIEGFSRCYCYFSATALVWSHALGNVAPTRTIYASYQSSPIHGAIVFQ
jgi:hypothetical protein